MPGADGIKTGYIRASGFNLATSMTRGNTRLVAVVMGGKTGASRDQEMIDMLDTTLLALKKREEEERQLAAREAEKRRLAAKEAEKQRLAAKEAEKQRLAARLAENEPPVVTAAAVDDQARFEQILSSPVTPRKALNSTAPYLSSKNWAVQVGAFPTIEQAEHAACLLYTSPSPRDQRGSRMPSSA